MKLATIADAPAVLNTNDKAMWVTGWNECAAQWQAAIAEQPVVGMQSIGYQLSYGNGSQGLWHSSLATKSTADYHIHSGGKVREVFVASKPVQAEAPTASNAGERTPKDYAIEHAEYMATNAVHLIAAVNDLAKAEQERDDGEANPSDVDAARETVTEMLSAMRSSIYEFRKRRDRAALATQQEAQPQTAEKLLRKLLAIRVAGASLYGDDGELQDNSVHPCIDFKRDSAMEIERKLLERGTANAWKSIAQHIAQAEPAGGDKEDAERWRAFISLPYAVRSEWATNLSLAPVLTGWLDSRASYLRVGDAPARGDDGLSASDADQLELAIGELEDDGETMVDYDDLMWFALRGYLHCKYFEVKPEAQEAIRAARAAQQATGERT
jgi:hypothetical protein